MTANEFSTKFNLQLKYKVREVIDGASPTQTLGPLVIEGTMV